MKRTPLKRVSTNRAKQLRQYTVLRKGILLGAVCFSCHKARATDVHHLAGRRGEMLNAAGNLIPVCRPCHDFIHRHPAKARERGLLK